GKAWEVETTAEFSGEVIVLISYGITGLKPEQELNLKLMILEGEKWVDITSWVDVENKVVCGKTSHLGLFAVMLELPRVTLDIDPDTLNLKSNGKWITAYIELSGAWNVGDIDPTSVKLNENFLREGPIEIGDHDGDGIPNLMVKFSRRTVKESLGVGEVEMKVSGNINAPPLLVIPFEGKDTIRTIKPGRGPK
ncbi:MAG: hypothetical protein QXG38_03040, partial [Candidatus Hadarchaeales archaeon]